ncbi:MAG: LysM peptidoglycan-binding domain-containing protein [Phycisphaerales bacterium]|nr:LysM peptidoglycan-binding domain-containing protein [Phycisphaerales bacterium]
MTREHKLALIVGFSLLLLVGVLISDHLSRAREARIDTVTMEPAAAVQAPSQQVPMDPLLPVSGSAAGSGTAETPTAAAVTVIPEPSGGTVLGLAGATPDTQRVAVHEPGAGLGGDGSLESSILRSGGTIAPADGGVREFTLGKADAPRAAVPPGGAPAKPAVPDRTHVVKKNETLFAIAKAYYGDGRLWTTLAEYNKDRIGRNGALREGQSLRIPARTVLTGKPDPAPARTVSPATIAAATRIASARTYIVKKNDTLGDVSKAMYGTSRRWRDILAANQSTIEDEDRLTVGMVLKVPG